MSVLELRDLTLNRGARRVLDGVSLSVQQGEFIGLIGPNGAGKTTLLRAALGLVRAEGTSSLAALPSKARAKAAAFLPQGREVAWPMAADALVRLGRTPHASPRSDDRCVEDALARLSLAPLRHRPVTELSGGELARVLIARLLAQDTPLLLADEPISGLDPAHQIAVMEIFATLATEGRAVIAALHDLGLAARHCTRLVMIEAGRIVADGPPGEVLTPALLAQVFGVSGYFAETPEGPVFQPLRRV